MVFVQMVADHRRWLQIRKAEVGAWESGSVKKIAKRCCERLKELKKVA